MPDTDVLFFVEDPGAANFVVPLPAVLARRGVCSKIISTGHATKFLAERNIVSEHIEIDWTPTQLLDNVNPSTLVVGTSENADTIGLGLVIQARERGIASFGVIDSGVNCQYRFCGNSNEPLRYAPDWLIVPDQATKDAFVSLGCKSERVFVSGHPHFDNLSEIAKSNSLLDRSELRKRVFPGLKPGQKATIFVAELSTGANPQQYQHSPEYTISGRGINKGRTEIVIEEFLDAIAKLDERPYTTLRLHPKNSIEEFASYFTEFDHVSSSDNPHQLIYAADLVVGITSMMLAEALFLQRQTFAIVPRPCERYWLPVHESAIQIAATSAEILDSLSSLLNGPANVATYEGELFTFGASERAADAIVRVLENP